MLARGGGRLLLRDQHRQRHDHRYSEEQGQLDLLHADDISATTDAGPIDIAAAPDGRQVFELNVSRGTSAYTPWRPTARSPSLPRSTGRLPTTDRTAWGAPSPPNVVPQESHNRPGGHCRPYDLGFQLRHYVLAPELREAEKLVEIVRLASGGLAKVDVESSGTSAAPCIDLAIRTASDR